MTLHNRRNITRWSIAVERRHRSMIEALTYMSEREHTTLTQLRLRMDWGAVSTARVMIRTFIDDGLVEYAGEIETGGTTPAASYRLLPQALETARMLYPTQKPEYYSELPIHQHVPSGIARNADKRQIVSIQRDPFDALLFGAGRAPSLNFKDSAEV